MHPDGIIPQWLYNLGLGLEMALPSVLPMQTSDALGLCLQRYADSHRETTHQTCVAYKLRVISACAHLQSRDLFCVPLRMDIMYSWSCTHNSTLTSFPCLLMSLSLLTHEGFLPIYRMTMDQLWPGKNSKYLCQPVDRNHNFPNEIWTTTCKRNSTSNFVFPWAFFLHSSKHFRVLFTSLQ